MSKIRLDQLVLKQLGQYSRQQIQSWIMQGKVTVDGMVQTKPGTVVNADAEIICSVQVPQYVSRAGYKLAHALECFKLTITDLVVLDAGISTGGFTDCLLQKGAARVYGIDVGYGQVHEKIRNNPRVIVQERVNLRTLKTVGELVDLVTLDLSFISVLKVMEAVCAVLKPEGTLIVLIKPQFEAGRAQVGRKGIVSDPKVHQQVVQKITLGIEQYGFICKGIIDSPITGGDGNKEFLAYFERKQILN